jgi:hypothetical protein
MEIDARIVKLEGEIKIMKNEVQAVLLDLREDFIKRGSISTSDDAPAPAAAQPIIIN